MKLIEPWEPYGHLTVFCRKERHNDCIIDQGRSGVACRDRHCRLHHHRRRHRAGHRRTSAPPSRGRRPAEPAARWSPSSATARCSRARSSRSPRKAGHRLRPAVERLGSRLGLGRRLGRPALGLGLGRLGSVGPDDETITHYSGQVLANLQGPGGFMRCHFTLMSPSSGMAGGGVGQCQLPTGTIIHAQFPPRRGLLRRAARIAVRGPSRGKSRRMATQLKRFSRRRIRSTA